MNWSLNMFYLLPASTKPGAAVPSRLGLTTVTIALIGLFSDLRTVTIVLIGLFLVLTTVTPTLIDFLLCIFIVASNPVHLGWPKRITSENCSCLALRLGTRASAAASATLYI
jgi:hypothetical protein